MKEIFGSGLITGSHPSFMMHCRLSRNAALRIMPHKVQIAAENTYHPEMKKKSAFGPLMCFLIAQSNGSLHYRTQAARTWA